MAGSSTQYGPYNPNAVDPFPIESVLAKEASTSPADAWNMLQAYRSSNQAQGREYAVAAGQQHDFARQQLSQQLYENQLKALGEAGKTPGMLDILASSPQYSGVLGGADPGVIHGVSTNLARNQAAETAQKGGAAVASLDNSGNIVPAESVTELTGLPVAKGDAVSTRNARISAAARVAAGHASQPAGVGFNIQLPLSATGGVPTGATIPGKLGYQAGMTQLRNQGLVPLEGQDAPGVVRPPSPDAQPKSKTNLRVAKTEGAGGTGPGVDVQAKAKQYLETTVRPQHPEAYKDIMAAAQGGRIQLKQTAEGVALVGKSGQVY